MDLIRDLLLEIEETPAGEVYETDNTQLPAETEVLQQHFDLLVDAGFIKDPQSEMSGNGFCFGLSWEGHEYLDSIRPMSRWAKIKEKAGGALNTMTLGLIKELGVSYAKQELGLGS
jgi:hypothetical protein